MPRHTRIVAMLRGLDRPIWATIAAVATVVATAPLVSSFYLDWRSFTAPAIAALALGAGAQFYRHGRPDVRLAAGLENTAQLVAFAAVGAPLSYLAASLNLPLQDHVFAGIDQALGLDWRAALALMNAHPVLHTILAPAYLSLTLQMTTAVLCLAFSGRVARLRAYTLSFILAALVTIALSGLLPAEGAWPYYGMTAADSPHMMPAVSTRWLPIFDGLRDGSYRALVGIGAEGIIPFPSLHAALAVIVTMALWPLPVLRWIAVALNIAMLSATPIEGSHYFIDIAAGVGVAALCFLAASKIVARADAPAKPAATPILAGLVRE